ncbi:hypothetical protein Mal52_21870 [Symmachiella dynata]|uniref:Uncharacterized protein n=1 Tax=Symmachiella dynata TaxID=2527995 RepID=A0A517ZML7_9PLAN|nr:hypothetical protein [Symmachiella dynata]QDU43711.1 hypothetical protein Mal52_21870 [Symmachiella dynata]
MTKKRCVLVLMVLACWGLSSIANAADKQSDIQQRLEAILNERAAITGVYAWDFELLALKGQLPDIARQGPAAALKEAHQNGLASFKEQPKTGEKGYTSGNALFDCNAGRFYLNVESVSKWVNGAAPHIATRVRWGFDGETYSMWTRSRQGTSLPPQEITPADSNHGTRSIAEGEISKTVPSTDTYRAYLSTSGTCFLPPFVNLFGKEPLPTNLKEFIASRISSKSVLAVTENKDGIIEFSFESPNASPQSTKPDKIVFTFDQRHGGMLTRVSKFSAGLPHAIEEYLIEPGEWEAGVWGPAQITYVNWLNGFGSRAKLTQRKIRQDVEAKEFRVEMPMGTMVNDNISKMSYIVADGSIDEAQSKERYVAAHNVVPVLSHDANQADGFTPKALTAWAKTLIAISLAILIGIAVIGIRRFRRGSTA